MPRTDGADAFDAFARAMDSILARVFHGETIRPVPVSLAFSGGLDSTVLLEWLCAFAGKTNIRLHVFHVHHGLSHNADAWLMHCEREAASRHLTFDFRKVTIAKREPRGIEAAARAARYRALGEMCLHHRVPLLLTAHHRNDQAETVLLQAMRGAGIAGIAGMPLLHETHPLLPDGVAIARPLLEVDRATLETEAHRTGLTCVEDESNADVRFRRNAIRHDILPRLQAISPGSIAGLARLARHGQQTQRLLDDLAQMDLAACGSEPIDSRISLQCLQRLDRERRGNLLRYWLRHQGCGVPGAMALDELSEQMLSASPDAHPVLDLGRMRLRRIAGFLEIAPVRPSPPVREPFTWSGEAVIDFPHWHGKLVFSRADHGLPAELLRSTRLELRTRAGGEQLRVHPQRPTKALKKLYQELHIPSWKRTFMPLLYADGLLIFAAGLGINHDVAACDKGEGGAVGLHWEPAESVQAD